MTHEGLIIKNYALLDNSRAHMYGLIEVKVHNYSPKYGDCYKYN